MDLLSLSYNNVICRPRALLSSYFGSVLSGRIRVAKHMKKWPRGLNWWTPLLLGPGHVDPGMQ